VAGSVTRPKQRKNMLKIGRKVVSVLLTEHYTMKVYWGMEV
jgi:hypothetical protein